MMHVVNALRAWLAGRFQGDSGAALVQWMLLVVAMAVLFFVSIDALGGDVQTMFESSGQSITGP